MPKILLVEDTEAIQKMYAYGLQQEGFEVTTASSAGEALAKMEGDKFDFILLDLMLTGMSGLDFLKAANVKTTSPGTRIVVLTNLDNPKIKETVESFGVDGYLNKSEYEPKQLSDFIKNLG
jgi:DNA-binding response OmpR family regulator